MSAAVLCLFEAFSAEQWHFLVLLLFTARAFLTIYVKNAVGVKISSVNAAKHGKMAFSFILLLLCNQKQTVYT